MDGLFEELKSSCQELSNNNNGSMGSDELQLMLRILTDAVHLDFSNKESIDFVIEAMQIIRKLVERNEFSGEMAWDIAALIPPYLGNQSDIEHFQISLDEISCLGGTIAENCLRLLSPKESLMVLLSDFIPAIKTQKGTKDSTIDLVFRLLNRELHRLGSNNAKVSTHLESILFSVEEELVAPLWREYLETCDYISLNSFTLFTKVTNFLVSVRELSFNDDTAGNDCVLQRQVMLRFCIQILSIIVEGCEVYNVDMNGVAPLEGILNLFQYYKAEVREIIQNVYGIGKHNFLPWSITGCALLIDLALSSVEMRPSIIPFCMSPVYVFQNLCPFSTCLMSLDSIFCKERGMHLLDQLLNSVPNNTIVRVESGGDNASKQLVQMVLNCLAAGVSERVNSHKQTCVFNRLMYVFTHESRFELLRFGLTAPQSVMVSLVINHMLKETTKCWDNPITLPFNSNMLLKVIPDLIDPSRLRNKSEIVQFSDSILTALQYIRFLLIRCKNDDDKVGLWSHQFTTWLKNDLIIPLKSTVDEMCREEWVGVSDNEVPIKEWVFRLWLVQEGLSVLQELVE